MPSCRHAVVALGAMSASVVEVVDEVEGEHNVSKRKDAIPMTDTASPPAASEINEDGDDPTKRRESTSDSCSSLGKSSKDKKEPPPPRVVCADNSSMSAWVQLPMCGVCGAVPRTARTRPVGCCSTLCVNGVRRSRTNGAAWACCRKCPICRAGIMLGCAWAIPHSGA